MWIETIKWYKFEFQFILNWPNIIPFKKVNWKIKQMIEKKIANTPPCNDFYSKKTMHIFLDKSIVIQSLLLNHFEPETFGICIVIIL